MMIQFRSQIRAFVPSLLAVSLALSMTACLRTRAQLKDDGDEPDARPKPVPAQVQDVQPQGQYVIDEIKSELTRMTGRLEDLERHNAQTEGGSATAQEQIAKLETRIQELEQAQVQMIEAIKKMQSTPVDPAEAFDKGRRAYEGGDDDAAIEAFTRYLKGPDARHAEEATFLRGETYFRAKQYKKAIVDYSQFPEKWKKSRRMPAALLRIGQSFEALGMKEDAQGFYQEVIDKYPKSPEAGKARAKAKRGKKPASA
jgi:tol-pal system protein YbgF